MASGNFSSSSINGLSLYVEWSSTSDIETNSSSVTATLYVKSYGFRASALSGSYLTVNGNQKDWTYTFNIADTSTLKTTKVATHTVKVNHDSDGKKSITIKANLKLNGYYGGTYISNLTASKTVDLDNIPRASSLSVPSSVNVYSNINVTITPSNSSYRHKVKFVVDGASKYTSDYIAAGTKSFSYLIPRSWISGTADQKMTVYLYTYTSSGTSSIGSKSTTTTIKVPCSTFTIPSSTNTGAALKVTISPDTSPSGSWKHKVALIINGTFKHTSDFIASGTNSYSYDIPHSWLSSTGSTTMTVRLYTYNPNNNDDYTARTDKTLTVKVPDSVAPSITSITPTIVNGLNGNYVQGKSQVKLTVSAKAGDGSSLSSYIYKGANINGASSSYTGTSSSKTSSVIQSTGTQTYSVQVKDKRDRYSTTKTTSIKVYEYTLPEIKSISAKRCTSDGTLDTNGTYAKVTVTISYAAVGGANKRVVKLYSSKDNYATATTVLPSGITDTTYTGVYGGGGFDTASSYQIKAVITDSYATDGSISKFAELEVSERTLNIAKYGNGVSVGGLSTVTSATAAGKFECNWDAYFSDSLYVTNKITCPNPYSARNFNINCYWKDGEAHDILVRNNDGLTIGLGWAGNDANETVLDIRPKNVNMRGTMTAPRGRFTATTDAAVDSHNDVPLRIGDDDGIHLDIDGNEIQCKSTTTASNPLYLNNDGGDVYVHRFRIPEIQHGRVQIIPSAANTPTSKIVTFEQEFSGTPHVVATPLSGVPGTTVLGVSTLDPTSTSVNVYLTRANTTATSIEWIAAY